MWLTRSRILVATLWVGSLWAIGYLAAPTLFAFLPDRVLAGTIAGMLFRSVSWLSLACGLILLVLQKMQNRKMPPQNQVKSWLIVAMLACTLVGYFGLQPFMAALRESAVGGSMRAAARAQFGMLHGLSMGIYLIESLLGVALIVKLQRS